MCNRKHEIIITNFNNNEIVKYAIVLIKGYIRNFCSYNKIEIINNNCTISEYKSGQFKVSIINGQFKILVHLINNENNLTLNYCHSLKSISLQYLIDENNDYKLKLLYIICEGHDGHFQCNKSEDNDNNNNSSAKIACRKITLGIKLIQCLIGEKLYEQNFGHKSFQIDSATECVEFLSMLNVDDAKMYTEHQLWDYFAKEIISSDIGKNDKHKFIAFLGCTQYEGITDENYSYENIKSKTVANVALGGGGLAIFGTGCLYTWPTEFNDVICAFENQTIVDMKLLMDDSNYRRTYGGCFSTTLGSVCHEIGHTFDLGHTQNGIMGNGFDYINRVFTIDNLTENLPNRLVDSQKNVIDKKNCHTTTGNNIIAPRLTNIKKSNNFLIQYQNQKDNDLTFFAENSAIILYYHKWFNNYNNNGEVIKWNKKCIIIDRKSRFIKSIAYPLCLIEFRENQTSLIKYYFTFLNNKIYEHLIPSNVIIDNTEIFVIDSNGNIEKSE